MRSLIWDRKVLVFGNDGTDWDWDRVWKGGWRGSNCLYMLVRLDFRDQDGFVVVVFVVSLFVYLGMRASFLRACAASPISREILSTSVLLHVKPTSKHVLTSI
jgi:hypothetical protein